MRSRWTAIEGLEPEVEYLVLATSLPAKKLRSTWRLFRGSSAVRRQLADAEGLIGFSMLAEPLSKNYATLSVWRDEAALEAFSSCEPHRQLMGDLAPDMGRTRFVRWTVTGSDGVPTWDEALERLG